VTPSAAGLETSPAHDAESGDYALALVRRVQHREIEQAAEADVACYQRAKMPAAHAVPVDMRPQPLLAPPRSSPTRL
jgi:hypothetical protein